jgi:cation diffusion facilitator family transporter
VLTDCWTSLGVVVGLSLAMLTGWLQLDPILAILVAINILWSGGKLIRRSIGGLMDEVDSRIAVQIKQLLDSLTTQSGVGYHGLRHRNAGNTLWVEFHLLFPRGVALDSAHAVATQIEEALMEKLPMRTEVITHLETLEDHERVHSRQHYKQLSE